jgi:hypothetical protein
MTDTTDAEDRWYEAARRADPVMLPNLRTGRRWVTSVTCAIVIAAVVVGYGLVFWPTLTGRPVSDLPDTLMPLLGLAFQRSAALLGVIALIVGALVTHVRSHWHPIIGAFNREERKSIRLQISGEDLVDYRRLPLIVVIAKQHHQYVRTLVPIYVAALLFTISWALLSDDAVAHYLSLGLATVLLAIGSWMLVTFRRSDAFIATHADRIYERTDAWEELVDDLYEKGRLEELALGADDEVDGPSVANESHPDETSDDRTVR